MRGLQAGCVGIKSSRSMGSSVTIAKWIIAALRWGLSFTQDIVQPRNIVYIVSSDIASSLHLHARCQGQRKHTINAHISLSHLRPIANDICHLAPIENDVGARLGFCHFHGESDLE
jgi:hypothetical protein